MRLTASIQPWRGRIPLLPPIARQSPSLSWLSESRISRIADPPYSHRTIYSRHSVPGSELTGPRSSQALIVHSIGQTACDRI